MAASRVPGGLLENAFNKISFCGKADPVDVLFTHVVSGGGL